MSADDFEPVSYVDDGRDVELRLDPDSQTIWATQAQIAALFETSQQNASQHLQRVFADGELFEGSNTRNIGIAGSAKPVRLYSLDAVISVGYRVNSSAATRFRQWATAVLRAYIEQGYVINEQMLRKRPDMLNELAAAIRALREGSAPELARPEDQRLVEEAPRSQVGE